MFSKQVTDYEKDRNEEAQRVYLVDGQCPDCRRTFKRGSDWGKKWCEEKGTGNLIEFMKHTERNRITRLENACDKMAALIKNNWGNNNPDILADRKELLDFWYGTINPNHGAGEEK